MQSPKISVILPVKNGEPYLEGAIDSVLAQSFTEFELILVDDGSTDSSMAIISAFEQRDPRVRLLKNPGAGLIDALNAGIASAAAPLIARMDADDLCLPERLQRQYDFLGRHPGIAVVGTQVAFIDERGAFTAKTHDLPQSPDAIARQLLKGCCVRHPTVLFRRAAFEKAGRYRPELDAEDYDLWLRMSEQGAIANLPDCHLLYRVHSAQISARKEWSQRLSRNLALLSARERRAGREDPIDSYACFTSGAGRQQCRGLGCDSRLCESVVSGPLSPPVG